MIVRNMIHMAPFSALKLRVLAVACAVLFSSVSMAMSMIVLVRPVGVSAFRSDSATTVLEGGDSDSEGEMIGYVDADAESIVIPSYRLHSSGVVSSYESDDHNSPVNGNANANVNAGANGVHGNSDEATSVLVPHYPDLRVPGGSITLCLLCTTLVSPDCAEGNFCEAALRHQGRGHVS